MNVPAGKGLTTQLNSTEPRWPPTRKGLTQRNSARLHCYINTAASNACINGISLVIEREAVLRVVVAIPTWHNLHFPPSLEDLLGMVS